MEEPLVTVKIYKYRWIILLIFCLYSAINFFQFLQYTIIANITKNYYNVDETLVDLAGLVFPIGFIIFFLPVNYLIEKYNLKTTALMSCGLTTAGNLIKLLSISRDRFYVVLIGQCLCAIGQVFMLSIPSKLASTWFGSEEVSTACAIAVFGTQIGVALGSIFPSNFVENSKDLDKVGEDFLNMNIINSSLTVAILIVVMFSKPPLPPSQSQVEIVENEKLSVQEIFKEMVKSKNYWLLLMAIGSSNGMYTCFGIIINGVYLHYFPNSEPEIGIISALAIAAGGCLGSVCFGYMLDKWHHFKLTSFFIIFFSAITYIFVALSMELESKLATYFTIPIFGFFIASTLLVGFEFVTEVMYPVSEAASCSVLTCFIYLFAILYTLIFDGLIDIIGYLAQHIIIVVLLTLNSFLIYFITPTLKRREANLKKE